MCVWRSIRPGISVKRLRSITSAPAGGAVVPIDVIRSPSIRITAFVITLPPASTTLPARIAVVAANEFGARQSTQARIQTERRLTAERAKIAEKYVFSAGLAVSAVPVF